MVLALNKTLLYYFPKSEPHVLATTCLRFQANDCSADSINCTSLAQSCCWWTSAHLSVGFSSHKFQYCPFTSVIYLLYRDYCCRVNSFVDAEWQAGQLIIHCRKCVWKGPQSNLQYHTLSEENLSTEIWTQNPHIRKSPIKSVMKSDI
jgi:hypothetical protein